MQTGYLTNTETGEEIPYVGFGDWENDEGTKLQEGEEYQFSDMECRQFDYGKYGEKVAHDRISEEDTYTEKNEDGTPMAKYDQACATEHTTVEQVSNRDTGQ